MLLIKLPTPSKPCMLNMTNNGIAFFKANIHFHLLFIFILIFQLTVKHEYSMIGYMY